MARLCFAACASTLVLLGAPGCSDVCESEAPAFQIDLELAPGVDAPQIATLTADVQAAGLRKQAQLDVIPLKANRRASFVVRVGGAGAGGFSAEVSVQARDDQGGLVAWGSDRYSASGDACNFFSLTLAGPHAGDGAPPDGGPPPDGPRPDGPPADTGPTPGDGGGCVDGAVPSGVSVNHRSIGTNGGTLFATGNASVTCGGRVVTFGGGASLPTKVGQGDRITLGGETRYILTRDSATQVTLQRPSAGTHSGVSYTIKRAFTSPAAWESARGGDLVGDNRREVGVCYKDGVLDAGVVISGSTTDAKRYMQLTVAASQRHDGKAGTGVILKPGAAGHAIEILDDHTRIGWLEITDWSSGTANSYDGINIQADQVLVEGVIVHDDGARSVSNPDCNGITLEADGKQATVRNSIVYHVARSGITIHNTPNATLAVESCTVWSCAEHDNAPTGYGCVGNYGSSTSSLTAVNVIAMGAQNGGADFFGALSSASKTNLSSDGTAPGSGSLQNQAAADQLVSLSGGIDLHLKSGAAAIDTGTDLSSKFSLDIDQESRPNGVGWDIGADER
jgi:hypothetical protein